MFDKKLVLFGYYPPKQALHSRDYMGLYRGSGGLVKNLKYVIKSFFRKKSPFFKRAFDFDFQNN